MVYTDMIHLIADSINELHEFAKKIGLKRHYYHGIRKKHPHYDLTNQKIILNAILFGAVQVTNKTIIRILNNA